MIRFDFNFSHSISARNDTLTIKIGKMPTYLCPIGNAVDVEEQYIWERYDNEKNKSYPVEQFNSSLSGKYWQQFEHDLIRSRLMTTPNQKLIFRCMMPGNSKFDNQVVWRLEIDISGKNRRGESIMRVGYKDVRLFLVHR